jgi:ABC-type histidine transport system ATPase subunit
VAIDGEDVTGMVVSEITSMMASRAERERHMTVVTHNMEGKVRQEY